jgi:hypothetical protein
LCSAADPAAEDDSARSDKHCGGNGCTGIRGEAGAEASDAESDCAGGDEEGAAVTNRGGELFSAVTVSSLLFGDAPLLDAMSVGTATVLPLNPAATVL